ncbi:MAG TPA: YhjD/YihY/BrkB family envelope integrity protein [Verrucomicrobiae bacterium]|jgi:membrane protein|nr:YhjD/YihY/BrkB family envelope integrity protein [Verrucomicrobiae bacterium]
MARHSVILSARGRIQRVKTFSDKVLLADLENLPPLKRGLYRQIRILYRAVSGFAGNRCPLLASALTYTTLLSLVPLLALMFATLKGFGVQNRLEPILLEKLSAGSEQVVKQLIGYINKTDVKALGAVGLASLLVTTISVIGNIEFALNRIWGVQRTRSISRKFSDYLSVLLTCPILFVAALGITSSVQNASLVQEILTLPGMGYIVLALAALTPYVLMWIALTFLYDYLPNTRVRFGSALYGGIIGGTLWQLAQWGYVHFQVGAARYNAIYGAFAQLPIFLVWLYMGWNIVLFGAVLSFAHQSIRTSGKDPNVADAPYASREELGLKLLWLIGKHFDAGEPRFSAETLARELVVSVRIVSEILERHCKAGFLVAATADNMEPLYILARPPEKIAVAEVLDAMRSYGGDPLAIRRVDGEERLQVILDRAGESRRAALARTTLRDLLPAESA